MKKNMLQLKGVTVLSKKAQMSIKAAGAVGLCDESRNCPRGTDCRGGLCYTNSGGGNCNEPIRICMDHETGCGCVYVYN